MLSIETLSAFSNLYSPTYNYSMFKSCMQLVYPEKENRQTMDRSPLPVFRVCYLEDR